MTFTSGKDGTVTLNGTNLPIRNWSVNPGLRISGTDNSKSGGFILRDASGGKSAAISFFIDQDLDENPFSAAPNLKIGTKVTNLKLHIDGTGGTRYWNFPSAVVESTPQGLDHAGTDMVGAQINLLSDGTFSYPGGFTP